MPDVPTMAEAGIAGYDFTAWAGIGAPAGTPAPIINRLYGEIAKILATPGGARLVRIRSAPIPVARRRRPLAALVRVEHAKLGEVIRAIGIKAE